MVHQQPQLHPRLRRARRVTLLSGNARLSQSGSHRLHDLRMRSRDGRHHRLARYRQVVQGPRDGPRHGLRDGPRPPRRSHLHDLLPLLRPPRRTGQRKPLRSLRRSAPLHCPDDVRGLFLHGPQARRPDRRSRRERRPLQGERHRQDPLRQRFLDRSPALRALLFSHLPLPEVRRQHAPVQPHVHRG